MPYNPWPTQKTSLQFLCQPGGEFVNHLWCGIVANSLLNKHFSVSIGVSVEICPYCRQPCWNKLILSSIGGKHLDLAHREVLKDRLVLFAHVAVKSFWIVLLLLFVTQPQFLVIEVEILFAKLRTCLLYTSRCV